MLSTLTNPTKPAWKIILIHIIVSLYLTKLEIYNFSQNSQKVKTHYQLIKQSTYFKNVQNEHIQLFSIYFNLQKK